MMLRDMDVKSKGGGGKTKKKEKINHGKGRKYGA